MRRSGRRHKGLDADVPVRRYNNDRAGRHVFDLVVAESEIEERDALARRRKERAVERVAQRLKAVRIANDHHFPARVQKDETVRAVEFFRRLFADFKEIAPGVFHRRAEIMHNNFRIGIAREADVVIAFNFFFEFFVVGELAVKREAEPFVLSHVRPLKRMREILVVAPACRVTDMPDRRVPGEPFHELFVLIAVALMKDFRDRAELFVRHKERAGVFLLLTARAGVFLLLLVPIRGNARGELTAILDVEEHSRTKI